jgi:hypothetical protein
MQRELHVPREPIVDLAILLEEALQEGEEGWYSGDQVMDLHRLKARLKGQEALLDKALARVQLQGTALVLTGPQKMALRREVVGLVNVCMNILQNCQLLDPELEL